MKKAMSRGEWLLICGPLVLFGGFAAFYVRWRAVAPATLNPSLVPLRVAMPIYDGRSVIGLGEDVDASNNHLPGSPYHFLRWNTKDGSLSSQFDESHQFYNWNFSRDGELLAMYVPVWFGAKPSRTAVGIMIVRRTEDGSELGSWPTRGKTDFYQALNIIPDNREVLTLDERLERHDIASGKVLGAIKASQVFSPDSRFDRLSFSPDGHMIAVLESGLYSPKFSTATPSSSQQITGRTTARVGGRMAILTFPAFQTVMRPKGDLYSDCGWESNGRLWAVAPVSVGSTPQKLVRASIDLKNRQTHLEVLELPSDYSAWNLKALAINGATGQVILSGTERVVVWGRDGQVAMTLKFSPPVIPKGGRYAPGADSPPRFSRDGRSLFRVNGKDVERYDMSRFLPSATPAQTVAP